MMAISSGRDDLKPEPIKQNGLGIGANKGVWRDCLDVSIHFLTFQFNFTCYNLLKVSFVPSMTRIQLEISSLNIRSLLNAICLRMYMKM